MALASAQPTLVVVATPMEFVELLNTAGQVVRFVRYSSGEIQYCVNDVVVLRRVRLLGVGTDCVLRLGGITVAGSMAPYVAIGCCVRAGQAPALMRVREWFNISLPP